MKLARRILSGVSAGGAIFGLLWLGARFDAPWLIGIPVAGVACLAAWEFLHLLESAGIVLSRWSFLPWVPVLVLASVVADGQFLNLAVVFALGGQLIRHLGDTPQRDGLLRASGACLGILYIPWLLHFVYRLYAFTTAGDDLAGLASIGAVLLMVWGYDSGAFFAGRLFGRHQAFPSVSPNKTWEGIVGGTLFAVLGATVGASISPLWRAVVFWGEFHHLLIAAILVAAAAQIGDLFASKLKRAAGVKDSGIFLPGHGGALDRIDGLLFALPVFFWYFVLFLRPALLAGP
ncbi:MAG: CDP-archaeol synthase [Candidatus Bipolaricaulota bacterium]|nr:MAG: CDP-archaeol synthase [Candidatus Bipolaricaulota bacterium]